MGGNTPQRLLPLQRRCHPQRRRWSTAEFTTGRDGLPTSWVFQLFETSDRRFWVATARGLVEFFPTGDEQGRRFRHYTERNGLSYYDITALNEDLGGNLWLGTNTAGAMKLTRDGFSTYGEQDGIETRECDLRRPGRPRVFQGQCAGRRADQRVRGSEAGPVERRSAPRIHTRLGCFDGQRFDWFKPARRDAISAGSRSRSRCRPATATGGWARGKGCTAFPRQITSRSSRRRDRLPCTRRRTGWPLCRCSGCSKTRAATSGSPPSSRTRTASPAGNRLSEKLRDLAHSAGLPSLKDDLPRSFGEDRSGNVWIGFNSGLARYAQGRFTFFTATRGTAARRDHEHPCGPLGPALARVRARRARSRRRRRGGATHVRQLHDRARAVEQQHRSHHRRRCTGTSTSAAGTDSTGSIRRQAASSISRPLTVWRRACFEPRSAIALACSGSA